MNSTYENEQKSQEEKNEKKNKLKVEINNLIEEIESMQNIYKFSCTFLDTTGDFCKK